MLSVNSVLWPTDGSDLSLAALETALDICKLNKAKLYVLQVMPEVPTLATGMTGISVPPQGFDVRLYEQELINMTKKQMGDLIGGKIPAEVSCEMHALSGETTDVINSFAKEHGIDVIVMATHGRTGMTHLLIGSVAEKTIRHATRPVLVVPTREKSKHEK